MTINLHCPRCKSGAKIGTKECKKCNHRFTPGNRKYRVTVKLATGNRKSKIVDSLELAKKVEAKLKTESIEHELFNIHKAPSLSDVWIKYLAWAKINKKSWTEDQTRWRYHIEPHLKNMKMDKVNRCEINEI